MAKTVDELKHCVEDNLLDLSLSSITDVPVKEIAQLKKVTEIDLSSNHLVTLSNDFAPLLRHVVVLDLSQNFLKALPGNFGQLVNLQHLDLYKNSLATLPSSFSQLKKLQWLDLKANPLSPELQEVAGGCLDELQCRQAASRVVKYMERVQLEAAAKQRKEQASKENKDRDMAKKSPAVVEKSTKKKTKDKQKSKPADVQAAKPVTETQTSTVKAKKLKGAPTSTRRRDDRCVFCDVLKTGFSKVLSFIVRVLLLLFFVAVFGAVLLYVACSENFAVIPQRKAVCNCLYEHLVTDWDLLTSVFSDQLEALRTSLHSSRRFLKDAGADFYIDYLLAFVAVLVDNAARFLAWFSHYSGTYLSSLWKTVPEWPTYFWLWFEAVIAVLQRYSLDVWNGVKLIADDLITNCPVYWEKIKFAWRNLK